MAHIAKMFRAQHRNTAGALALLARVDLKEGKTADALDTAVAAFGEGAGGIKAPTRILPEASKAIVT